VKRPEPKAPRDRISRKDFDLVREFCDSLSDDQKIRLAGRLRAFEKTEAINLLLRMAERVGSAAEPPIDEQHVERQGEEGKNEQLPEKKTRQKRKPKQFRQGEEKTEIEEVE
jgi:hypothetical protein